MSTHAARRSPWGPLHVNDAHVHFFSHRFFTGLIAQKPGLTLDAAQKTLSWELPPEDPELLALRWIEELDRHGIQSASIIASLLNASLRCSTALGTAATAAARNIGTEIRKRSATDLPSRGSTTANATRGASATKPRPTAKERSIAVSK